MWCSGSNTGTAGDLLIPFLVENLRMLLICPDIKRLHELHVVPMYTRALQYGYRDDMGWADFHSNRSHSYVSLRNSAFVHFRDNFKLGRTAAAEGQEPKPDDPIMLTDQAEKYMKSCDYLWVHSCRHQKQQATQILQGLQLRADNLRGHLVVEALRMCRMIIEGVEPNTLLPPHPMRYRIPLGFICATNFIKTLSLCRYSLPPNLNLQWQTKHVYKRMSCRGAESRKAA